MLNDAWLLSDPLGHYHRVNSFTKTIIILITIESCKIGIIRKLTERKNFLRIVIKLLIYSQNSLPIIIFSESRISLMHFLYEHNLTTNSPCSLHWWSINWDEKVKIKLVHIFYKFFVSFFEWIQFLNVLMSSTQSTVKYSESLGEGSKYCNMCTHKYRQLNFITIYCLNQHYITRVMKMFWCLKYLM